MSEGRRSQVVLLDERRLDLLIQPKLYAGELLDLVASHFHLKEKEYFGIAYPNETGQYSWLQLDRRVLDHDFPKKCSSLGAPPLTLYFRVKYYVESIAHLRDSATVEAFYLQAKSLLSKGELEADSEIVLQLAALVLQATYGDFVDESVFRSHLRRLPILPTVTLKEYTSITQCEDKVLEHYKGLIGQSRGDAIVNYLTIVESLPTYGQHYYEVKDKTGSGCWLGLSYKGISQYEKNDRRFPSRVFLWKQLENLYYRDKKFTIEVHEVRRVIHTLSSFNLYEDAIEEPVEDYDDLSDAICDPTTQVSVSRRTLAPANVTVYVWYAVSPIITKCIWSMAIAQHHFFLDRRLQKSQSKLVPCLSQIATELCRSVQSLNSIGSHSNISTSSSSLPSTILGGEISEESKAATIEMLAALQARREALEEALKKKNEELKSLCLKEGELTGEIPPEIPLQPGEDKPQVRRRIGTSFSLSDKLICKVKNKERETLSDIELEYEIQSKIASAAFQLANDCTARKSVRKQRKLSYVQATAKLRNLELKLLTLRKQKATIVERNDDTESDGSESGVSATERVADDCSMRHVASCINPSRSLGSQSASETGTLRSSIRSSSSIPPCGSLPQLAISANDCVTENSSKGRHRHQSLQHMPYSDSLEVDGEQHCNVPCTWNVSYCPVLEPDTISCNSSTSALPLRSSFKNRFESRLDIEGSNLYSVRNRRASQVFDSQDDLLLGGRKSDLEKSSPSTAIPLNHIQYSNVPLSASYDERLWCGKANDLAAASSDCSSLETSFDAHSSNSCDNYFEAPCHNSVSVELPKSSPKLHHFYSEHSLHREEFDKETTLAKEKEMMKPLRKIVHVQSVPHLHEEVVGGHELYGKSSVSSNSNLHGLNQVVDLVNASILRQRGKKSAALSIGESLSPKAKTKEWIETSLDSPSPVRKSKSRPVCDSPMKNDVPSHTYPYESHNISLSPYPQDWSSTAAPQVPKTRHPSEYSIIHDEQWATAETSSSQSVPYSPVQLRKKPVCDFRDVSKDFGMHPVCTNTSNAKHTFSDFPDTNEVIVNGHISGVQKRPQLDISCGSMSEVNPVSGLESHMDMGTYHLHAATMQKPSDYDIIVPCDPHYHSTMVSSVASHHNVPPTQSPNTPLSNTDNVHYNEATVVDIPQEIVETLSPCNNTGFLYPGNVEVNVVSLGHFQPYWEETKPYEISDFYKYSTKHRKPQHKLDDTDSPKQATNQQWAEHESHASVNTFQNQCDAVVPNPCIQNSVLINSHMDQANYKELDINCLYEVDTNRSLVASPQSARGDGSFGEVGIRLSVADAFHDEMLAWYENRDHVKKATLV